jgi:hypothetical protein
MKIEKYPIGKGYTIDFQCIENILFLNLSSEYEGDY